MLKLIQFKCKKCGNSQEELVSSGKSEGCQVCKAKPSSMKVEVSNPKHGKHVSWSKWNV